MKKLAIILFSLLLMLSVISAGCTVVENPRLSSSNSSISSEQSSTTTNPSSSLEQSSITSSSNSSSQIIDYGTLTIDNVNVETGSTADINFVFSKPEYQEEISYSYEGMDIIINGNSVLGLVEGAVVTVTATTSKHSATFIVTVNSNYGTLTIPDVDVEYGKTATITPNFSTTAGSSLDVTYSYDTSKISINGNTVTGLVAEAVVTVTATTSKHSTTFTVTVGKDYGTLTFDNMNVEYNETATISPKFSTTAGSSLDITYSYDTSKISINGNTVTGLVAEAVVTVTATTSKHSTTFTVTVGKDYGTLTFDNISVEYGKTATITPNFSTTAGSSLAITYTYDTSKISISGNTVTGKVAEAVVTVTATTSKHTATFKVTVGKDYGTLTFDNVSVEYGKTATITPKFSTTAGSSLDITYTYDTTLITIDGNTVTGKVAEAVVTVTATTTYHSTTFKVTVGKDYGTLTFDNVSVSNI